MARDTKALKLKSKQLDLCYCIPDFHDLTMDTAPDASDLIE